MMKRRDQGANAPRSPLFTWQPEAVELAGHFLGEEALFVVVVEERIAAADVDASAGNRGSAPDGAERDFLEQRSGRGVEGDQLAAGDGGEVSDAVGERDS